MKGPFWSTSFVGAAQTKVESGTVGPALRQLAGVEMGRVGMGTCREDSWKRKEGQRWDLTLSGHPETASSLLLAHLA